MSSTYRGPGVRRRCRTTRSTCRCRSWSVSGAREDDELFGRSQRLRAATRLGRVMNLTAMTRNAPPVTTSATGPRPGWPPAQTCSCCRGGSGTSRSPRPRPTPRDAGSAAGSCSLQRLRNCGRWAVRIVNAAPVGAIQHFDLVTHELGVPAHGARSSRCGGLALALVQSGDDELDHAASVVAGVVV
jgi:hypothetical protein